MSILVICIDKGKRPVYNLYEPTEDDVCKVIESDNVKLYSSYKIAHKFIKEWNENNEPNYDGCTFIQRIVDPQLNGLGIYIDEEGRVEHLTANRNLILQNGQRVAIAGRIVVIMDFYFDGDICAIEVKDKNLYENQLSRFMHYNDTYGTDVLSLLTQEESDRVEYGIKTLSESELLAYLKRIADINERIKRDVGIEPDSDGFFTI